MHLVFWNRILAPQDEIFARALENALDGLEILRKDSELLKQMFRIRIHQLWQMYAIVHIHVT